ncbi:hypothetical protein [Chitinimonas sp. JJ19]|uniref:hypothetical protein n=1 Tax=Chitinimonas sp. JJ19 TaxID=3109352 RepID=UPI0030024991
MSSRQAALTLHGMNAADQAWLLSQLDAEERAQMQSLLDELRDLGIPADASLAPHHDDAEQATELPVVQCLVSEPAWLLGMLLRVRSWPWQAELLAALDRARREEVLRSLQDDGPLAPALSDALLAQFESRLAELQGAPVRRAAKPASRFSQVAERIKQWLP